MSEQRKCRKCKDEKPISQFPEWAGKPGHVCSGCKVPTGAAAKAKAEIAAPELSLAFPAGFGFDANTHGDVFQLDQWPADNGGEAVSIVLSRAELATIVAHFGPWASPP